MKKLAGGRTHFNLPDRGHDYPFSDGVIIGDTVYLSGRIGMDPKTGRAATDVEEEARLLMEGFREVLAKVSMGLEDLVFCTVYCTDMSLFLRFNAVYRTYFKKGFPARAFLGCSELVLGARFEMQAIAVRSGQKGLRPPARRA